MCTFWGIQARGLWILALGFACLSACFTAMGCAHSSGPRRPERTIYYPEPPAAPRLQFLTSLRSSKEFEQQKSSFKEFILGSEGAYTEIQGAWGLAFSGDRLYVCDVKQRAVPVIDFNERTFSAFKTGGRGKLRKPIQCEFDAAGHLYFADRDRRQVVRFDADGNFVRDYGPLDDRSLPLDMAVRGGELYVCDIGNRCIQVLDLESGEKVRTLGSPANLIRPTNFALTDDACYVVDTVGNKVVSYSHSGELLRIIGGPGDVVGQFGRAKGIAAAPDGFIYVVDSAAEVCQIFSPEGQVVLFFGGPGTAPGRLVLPTDVFITEKGLDHFEDYYADDFEPEYLVFIVNQYGPNGINVYAFGKSKQYDYD